MVVLYVLIGLVGGAISVFALQNLDPVVLRFLVWRIEGMPLALVILLSIAAGALLASLVGVVQGIRQRSQIRQLERRLAQMSARAAPAADSPPPR